jgi:hypothetical protein
MDAKRAMTDGEAIILLNSSFHKSNREVTVFDRLNIIFYRLQVQSWTIVFTNKFITSVATAFGTGV